MIRNTSKRRTAVAASLAKRMKFHFEEDKHSPVFILEQSYSEYINSHVELEACYNEFISHFAEKRNCINSRIDEVAKLNKLTTHNS
ncbi:hypothetical protein GJ496_010833 [Pomphorhynchus laevis]|nr:hypothetical protein GJ496_010833 [Pomphorhynchus laevis]